MGSNINRRRVDGGKDYGNEGLSYAVSYVTGELLLSRNSFKNYWIANVHSDVGTSGYTDFAVAVVNEHIYWSNRTGLYKSIDDGQTFQLLHTYRSVSDGNSTSKFCIAINEDESYIAVFIYMYNGCSIVYSRDYGTSFTERTNVYSGLMYETHGGANAYPFRWFYVTNSNIIKCINFESLSVNYSISMKGYLALQTQNYIFQTSSGYRLFMSNGLQQSFLLSNSGKVADITSRLQSITGSSNPELIAVDGTLDGSYIIAISYGNYEIIESTNLFLSSGTMWEKKVTDYLTEAGISTTPSPYYTTMILLSLDKKLVYIHSRGALLTIDRETKLLLRSKAYSESDPFYNLNVFYITKYRIPEPIDPSKLTITVSTLSGTVTTQSDSSGTFDGKMYILKGNNVNSSEVRMLISFNNVPDLRIVVHLDSEYNYDYVTVGNLDSTCNRSTYQYTLKGSSSSTKLTIKVTNDGGSHYIQICYSKDSSQSSGADCGYVQIYRQ